MGREWRFERTSAVPADAGAVWGRVITPDGINDEMRPWMTMSVPPGAEGITIDTLPLGETIGRSRVRLFGVLPFDHDDLCVTEVEPGRRFHEDSTMRSMRRWVHDRTVEPGPDGGTRVTDRVTFVPRAHMVWAGPLLRRVLSAFFAHRHRRLARHFAGGRAAESG